MNKTAPPKARMVLRNKFIYEPPTYNRTYKNTTYKEKVIEIPSINIDFEFNGMREVQIVSPQFNISELMPFAPDAMEFILPNRNQSRLVLNLTEPEDEEYEDLNVTLSDELGPELIYFTDELSNETLNENMVFDFNFQALEDLRKQDIVEELDIDFGEPEKVGEFEVTDEKAHYQLKIRPSKKIIKTRRIETITTIIQTILQEKCYKNNRQFPLLHESFVNGTLSCKNETGDFI